MTEAGAPLAADLVEEFRRRLREAREQLLATVTLTDDELATLEAHQPGGPTEDVPTETVASILSRLEGRERHALDAVFDAQARLESGKYGTCEDCTQPIPLARLRAVPTARFCVACQAKVETGEVGR